MARKDRMEDVTLKGLQNKDIIFRNFEGVANRFNNAGDKNFCIIIDEELAGYLQSKGFTIKHTNGSEDYEPAPYIKIKLGFTRKDGTDNPHPPKIFKIDSTGIRQLNKDTVKILDGVRFTNVDLIFSASPYIDSKTNETRYSAYLSHLYATIEENELEREYNERFAGMDSQDPNGLPFNT